MSQNGLARDASIASLTGGASQTALGLNGNRQYLAIENSGTANVGVNICGGAAAIGGTGTLTLSPGGSLLFDKWVPQNQINVIGTAGQPLTIVEG
jgi:hypothetical protein